MSLLTELFTVETIQATNPHGFSKYIARVLYGAEEKITIRKGLAQTGFAKRDPPKFNGSVLEFPLIKKYWGIEVSPSGLPELIELNYLKNSIPSSANDRLYEVDSLKEAWIILDKIYGKNFVLRNKLNKNFWESIFLLELLL